MNVFCRCHWLGKTTPPERTCRRLECLVCLGCRIAKEVLQASWGDLLMLYEATARTKARLGLPRRNQRNDHQVFLAVSGVVTGKGRAAANLSACSLQASLSALASDNASSNVLTFSCNTSRAFSCNAWVTLWVSRPNAGAADSLTDFAGVNNRCSFTPPCKAVGARGVSRPNGAAVTLLTAFMAGNTRCNSAGSI